MKVITKYTIIAHNKEKPYLVLNYPEYDSIETPLIIYKELKRNYNCQIIKKTMVIYESCIKISNLK